MFPSGPVESGTDMSCHNITLENDDILEDLETFLVSLTSNDPSVILQNSEGTVTIEDDDGMWHYMFYGCIQDYHIYKCCADGMLTMDPIVTVEEGQNVMVCIILTSSGTNLGYTLTVDLDVIGSTKAGITYVL